MVSGWIEWKTEAQRDGGSISCDAFMDAWVWCKRTKT